jgi:signal peptidase II
MLAGMPGQSYLADTVRVAYAENTGGFLSLGASLPPVARTALFSVATGIAILMLVIIAVRRRTNGLARLGVTLFVAGGASNWIDRIVRGSVVDFLNVGVGPVRTGIFNVADMAIMLGVGIFVLAEFQKEQEVTSSTSTDDGTA